MKSIVDLRFHIINEKYDLIHCHWGYNTIFAYNWKTPIITTYHGSDLQGVVDKSGNRIMKGYLLVFLSRLSTYISHSNIFVSEKLLRTVPRKNKNMCNTIIPMGYNERIFKPLEKIKSKNKLGLSKSKKYILFAGNYSQEVKGYPLAQQIMKILDHTFEIIKLNYAPHHLISNYMNASEVLLMTSYYEGAPVIVKEALACELPIVSTDVGDVKKIIKSYSNCFVINNRDPKTFAFFIEKSIKMKFLKTRGNEVESFSAKKMNNKVYELYHKLCKNDPNYEKY